MRTQIGKYIYIYICVHTHPQLCWQCYCAGESPHRGALLCEVPECGNKGVMEGSTLCVCVCVCVCVGVRVCGARCVLVGGIRICGGDWEDFLCVCVHLLDEAQHAHILL